MLINNFIFSVKIAVLAPTPFPAFLSAFTLQKFYIIESLFSLYLNNIFIFKYCFNQISHQSF